MEALAGFGAPVAITGVMLMGLGFSPIRAAVVVLLANTAPVAFGAIGTPIITAGALTGIPYQEIGAYVGRQTPMLAVIVPLLLVLLVDGARGVRETWPVALSVGATFAVAQFVASNFISVELTDIIASLLGLGRRGHHPARVDPAGRRRGRRAAAGSPGRGGREHRYAGPGGDRARRRDRRGNDPNRRAGPGGRVGAPLRWTAVPGLLPVPAGDRRVLPGQAGHAADEGARGDRLEDQVAGARRPRPQHCGQAHHVDGLQLPVVVVARHAPADLRDHHGAGLPAVAGQGGGGVRRDGGQAALRLPHGGERARPGLRHEPVGPDDHDRHLDRGHRRVLRVPLADPRLAGHGRHRVRHHRRTRCSPPCSRPRRRRPASTRPCWSRPTPPAASSAR